jgi:hypothetical protein
VNVRDHDYDLQDERPIPLRRAAERGPDPASPPVERGETAAASRREAAEIMPADGHPLAAFRRFRMDVVLVEPHDEEVSR